MRSGAGANDFPGHPRPQEIRITGQASPNFESALSKSILPVPGDSWIEKIWKSRCSSSPVRESTTRRVTSFSRENNKISLNIPSKSDRGYGPPFLKPAIFIEGASGAGDEVRSRRAFDFPGLSGARRQSGAPMPRSAPITYSGPNTTTVSQGGKWF